MKTASIKHAGDDLAQALDLAAEDMRAVDALIRQRLKSDVVLVNQVGEYIIQAGGKRLRPVLHLLSARACGQRGEMPTRMAAVIEFIHTATLLHDDVVDESEQRRGRETAHTIWGNAASVLVGDFLYSRSFQMMVEMERMAVMRILADTTNTIAEGEVMQLMHMGNAQLSEGDYMQVIHNKTACLFSAACRLGAVLANAPEPVETALAEYGTRLGLAFQVADDLLDYASEDADLGKNLGDDLAEGKVTLPLILAMERATESDRGFLEGVIAEGGTSNLDRVRKILADTGALETTGEGARALAEQARQALEPVPNGAERDALAILARHAAERSY